MAKSTIKIDVAWLKESTNLSKCIACNGIIYGEMVRVWIMSKVDKLNPFWNKTTIILCESCYTLVN